MKRYETADIFDRLRFSKTVRDLCRDGLQLVRDQLNCSRVFVFLNETPADSGEPFYGFYGVDQPIEKKEDVLRLMKSVSEVASSSSVLKRETEVIDFCGKVLGQADQLCIQITLPGGGALGWFAADNFTDKKEWDPGSIEFVQTFSAFFSVILSMKEVIARQARENLRLRAVIDRLPVELDRREKEGAEQNTAFINAIFNTMEDRFYFKDRQSRLLGANRAWLRARNVESIDALLGKTDIDFFPDPLGKQLYDEEQRQMEAGEVTRSRERQVAPDGTVRYIEAVKCPMRNEAGEVIGVAGVSRDVTRQVENEEQLIIARKNAENAAKAKSAFLANMSHEIRTPLNAVIGMTTLLADSEMSEEQRDFVQTIQTSGEALLTLINDILDLSKIEAGALRLEMIPFNLRHCVESSLDIVAHKAFEKGLELACSVNGDVPQIFIGDSSRLRQVLLNLLNNAIKFTATGEVVVRVAGVPVQAEYHRLDFSVTDTGIGMTEETAKRVFTPFEQADSSTTRKYGGTGLGLSICNRLVEMMGGSLHVKSSVGVGSEFTFNIILRRASDDTSAQARINREILKGKRVLIVDDNQTNLKILEEQLRAWEITPLAFSCGKNALVHLNSLGRIDFAILDMMMPEMDGEMLAAALRKRTEFLDRPILVLSSTGNASIAENSSVNAWLTKPAKPDHLLEKLALLLEHAETGRISRPEKIESSVSHTLGLDHPLRILVAEDNVVNQKVALRLLGRLGYSADLVTNGVEAVEAVQNKTYDLVLMDIQMPLMNGLDATRKILQLCPNGNAPKIVAMTAHALQENREEGFACGMDGYIVKPIRFEDLIDTIKEIPRRAD